MGADLQIIQLDRMLAKMQHYSVKCATYYLLYGCKSNYTIK
jgi:hypothetical protein